MISGGLLGLVIFIASTITAVAGALLGMYIDHRKRSVLEKKLQDLSDANQKLEKEIETIRLDMKRFETSLADLGAPEDDQFVCIETFLSTQHSWEQFQRYLDEEILSLCKKQPEPAQGGEGEEVPIFDLVAVGSAVFTGAAAGAALAHTTGMESPLAIGGAAVVGGAVGGAVVIAKRATQTMAVEEAAP